MPETMNWTCPVCLTESHDDYNVTRECWEEAGFISRPCLKQALADYDDRNIDHTKIDPADWWKGTDNADNANWWKGEFTYYRNTHIDCLATRLGRRFTVDDFPAVPCNIGIREMIASGGLIRLPETPIGRKLRWRMITLETLWLRYNNA